MSDLIRPVRLSEQGVLSDALVESWRLHGYALVDNLLPERLIQEAVAQLQAVYDGEAGDAQRAKRDFGGFQFPFVDSSLEALNRLTLHSVILEAASRLLATDAILLTQSDAWAKYGVARNGSPYDNQDQRMHIDGWNHTLAAPPDWNHPVSVAMIVYLSTEQDCGGGTALVARSGESDAAYKDFVNLQTPGGRCDLPWMNDRATAEKWIEENNLDVAQFRRSLYERERRVSFTPGTVLLYRHDVWHRGTPLNENSQRLVVNLSFRRKDAPYWLQWNPGWAQSMYSTDQTLEKLIARASVEQRNVLGFPPPGDVYWNDKTKEHVRLRYEHFGIDLSMY